MNYCCYSRNNTTRSKFANNLGPHISIRWYIHVVAIVSPALFRGGHDWSRVSWVLDDRRRGAKINATRTITPRVLNEAQKHGRGHTRKE